MRRREFIAFVGGAVAWPLGALAQQAGKVWRIGYLGLNPIQASVLDAFRAGLGDLGYIEEKNIIIHFGRADSIQELPKFAAELVREKVDVIFAPSANHVEAARGITSEIPIVFAAHADPVGMGHVASLARPGGNITGLSTLLTEIVEKELELLKEAIPQSTLIGVLWTPTSAAHAGTVKAVEAAGRKLGIQLELVPIRAVADFNEAFARMTRVRVGSVLVIPSPLVYAHRALVTRLAQEHRLPSMFGSREHADAGGLISYGANVMDLHRRAAVYIDRILKGARPADLPVEQASKYLLVINLKTAKALGLTDPPIAARAR